MNCEIKSTQSYKCDIYIAGNITTIEEVCAEFCERGACVSIQPTMFVYTAGRESGAKITFISYARFPKSNDKLRKDAETLALHLLERCHQHSCTVIDDSKSTMITRVLNSIKEK